MHHLLLVGCTGIDDDSQSSGEGSSSSYDSTTSSSTSSNSSRSSYLSTEYGYESSSSSKSRETVIFVWAPGVSNEQLPEDIGFRFGSGSGGFTSVLLQTHYNNADGVEGLIDSSGVRVYYTSELRPIDMGILSLGDPNVDLRGLSLPGGKSSVMFECPGSCTEENFEVRPYARV